MSLEEAASILPDLRDRTLTHSDLTPDDIDNLFVSFIPPRTSLDLDGVTWVFLGFVDDRLYDINLSYSISWPTIDVFASKLSSTLSLPPLWEKSGTDSDDFRVLYCDGFWVSVGLAARPRLEILDTKAAELVKTRALLPKEQQVAEKAERARRKTQAALEDKKRKTEIEEEKKRQIFKP